MKAETIIRECTFGEALFILFGDNEDAYEKDFKIDQTELAEFLNKIKTSPEEIRFNNAIVYDFTVSNKEITDYKNHDFKSNWDEIFGENMNSKVKFYIEYAFEEEFIVDVIKFSDKVYTIKAYI